VATGLLGAAWIALWLAVAPATRSAPQRLRFDARLAAFLALYALGGLPLGYVLYGAPLYLARVLGQSQKALGSLLWIPPLGWELGYLATGWLVDRHKAALSPGVLCAIAFVGAPLAVVPLLPGLALPMVAFFLATLAAGSFIILAIAYGTRELGVESAGLLAGLGAGTWSLLVAVAMPVFGRLFDHRQFGKAFVLAGLAQSAGIVLWVVLEKTRARRVSS
jgi:ACS family hexuronate transporter-like MFS transporter